MSGVHESRGGAVTTHCAHWCSSPAPWPSSSWPSSSSAADRRRRRTRRARRVLVLRSLGVERHVAARRCSGFFLKSSTPAAGAQNVASNTSISVTFSEPVTLGKVTPQLTPHVGGKWVRTDTDTLTYQLDSPLIPSSHEVLTIPGGSSGLRGTNGAKLSSSTTVSFNVVAGDTLRLQQLLAGLDFLPLSFTPTGPAPAGPTWPRTSPATSPGAGPTSRPS